MSEINKIRLNDSIRQNPERLLETLGIKLGRVTKGQITTTCPFHDDNSPSFSISLDKGLWNCFAGCGCGDWFSLYARVKNLDTRADFRQILVQINELYVGGSNGN